MLLVLVGLAVALGEQKVNDDTPAKLTSQTVAGKWTGTGRETTAGVTFDFSGQWTVYFDADALNVRVDGKVTSKFLKVSDQSFNVIVHTGEKKITTHSKYLKQPCHSLIVEGAPPMDIVKSLLKDKIERKPDGMDGDYRKWNIDVPDIRDVTDGHLSMDLDHENGLRKVSEVATYDAKYFTFKIESAFTASDVKIGKPDAGLFDVPKKWGKCVAPPGAALAVEGPPGPSQLVAALVGHLAAAAPQLPRAEGGKALLVV